MGTWEHRVKKRCLPQRNQYVPNTFPMLFDSPSIIWYPNVSNIIQSARGAPKEKEKIPKRMRLGWVGEVANYFVRPVTKIEFGLQHSSPWTNQQVTRHRTKQESTSQVGAVPQLTRSMGYGPNLCCCDRLLKSQIMMIMIIAQSQVPNPTEWVPWGPNLALSVLGLPAMSRVWLAHSTIQLLK